MGKVVISFLIFILYFYILDSFFHEMGHALALRRIEGYSAIAFYIPIFKKFRVKIFGVEIFNLKNKKYKNRTYSKTNFQNLTENQVLEVVNGAFMRHIRY